jgi:hypothetical protein
MKIFSYILVIIGTLIGGFTFFDTMISAESAPQQSAGAAMALAWAVLPYCFARAVEKIGERSLSEILDRYFARRPGASPEN